MPRRFPPDSSVGWSKVRGRDSTSMMTLMPRVCAWGFTMCGWSDKSHASSDPRGVCAQVTQASAHHLAEHAHIIITTSRFSAHSAKCSRAEKYYGAEAVSQTNYRTQHSHGIPSLSLQEEEQLVHGILAALLQLQPNLVRIGIRRCVEAKKHNKGL